MRKFVFAFFIFVFIFLAASADADQRALALSLRFAISRAAQGAAKEKEALYLRIIDECPGTPEAEEAYWELSNLYLDEFDEPKEKESIAALEKFLKRYEEGESPSPWALHVKSRLKWLRGEIE
jgi:hypothetical protein